MNNIIVTLIGLTALGFTITSLISSFKIRNINRKRIEGTKTHNIINNIPEELINQILYNNIYIQPYIIRKGSTSKQLLHDFFIKKVFTKESKEPNDVYIIFGDTGTGKTAALVHLYNDYVTQYKQGEHPYSNIKFFSLRDPELDTIKNLPDKENTILLLDALDETPAAQDPTLFLQFQKSLQAIIHDFARVVITCRPQFFSNQEAASAATHTKIRTSTGWVQCTELFLTPFDNRQINQYLNQVFPFYKSYKKRKTAKKIVKKHAYIAIRPLVLTYIKDIVESKREINTTLDLYDIIIENTLHRDLAKIYPCPSEEQIQQWWKITSDVAGYMYQHHKPFITNQELDSIPSVTEEPQFKQRSMLTRMGNEFLFPHKSFYEYFMAYRFILFPYELEYINNMDFSLHLFNELLNSYFSQNTVRFADIKNIPIRNIAGSLQNIGHSLNNLNHFSEAEPKYQIALELFRQLEDQHPGKFIDDVAMTLNNLAILHRNTNNYPAAEKEYTEALKTYRNLAEKNPDAFLPYEASMLNNLANFYNDTNRYNEAKKKYNEALEIRRKLAEKNPDAYLPDVAGILNNLANLSYKTDQDGTSEERYTEALNIYQLFATKNPDAFLPYVAMTLNNLAVLHDNLHNYPAAVKEYTEALKTYRNLAEKNPDAFLPDVAMTLNNLAALHRATNNYPAAEKEYTESLKIRRDLAKKNPDAFLPDVAMTLYNMAILYLVKEEKDLHAAEAAALESLEKYKIMAEKSHAAFDPDVKDAEELLDEIQRLKQQK